MSLSLLAGATVALKSCRGRSALASLWFLSMGAWVSGTLATDFPTQSYQLRRESPGLSVADYARAERFLPWNAAEYVVNGDIRHHWIGNEDRFWYMRNSLGGERQFVVVNARTGARSPAFNHANLAAALSQYTGTVVAQTQLPFTRFHYVHDAEAIEFEYAQKRWRCLMEIPTCTWEAQEPASAEVTSPDGRWAVFRRGYDLWVRSLCDATEFPVTSDGQEHYSYGTSPGSSTHHVSDVRQGTTLPPHVLWSSDSKRFVTHRLDERKVGDLHLVQSVPEDGSVRPKLYSYRYALAGDEHLALVEPLVFDVTTRRRIDIAADPLISLPQTPIEKRDLWWSEDGRAIYYLRRDRFSRRLQLERADASSGTVQRVISESSETLVQANATNVFDFPMVRTLRAGDVIWYSQRDGWGHLYYYSAAGGLRRQITRGPWNVREIVRVDEVQRTIFFMGSGREPGRDPYEQRLYSVRFDGTRLKLLTPEQAHHHGTMKVAAAAPNDAIKSEVEEGAFSPSGKYFIDKYSRPDTPPVMVLRAADGRLIKQLEQADISRLREGGYVPVEPFEVIAADGSTPIYGNLFRPSTFDPRKKYPVIDVAYPGPQMIRTAKEFIAAVFDPFQAQALAELGFIVVTIDGRGTPYRSKAFLEHSYGRLGLASDLEDHIEGLQQLAKRYPYLDLQRVGIDGASGGGFMAALAVLSYPNFYKVAVAAEGNYDQRAYLAAWGETYNGPVDRGDYLSSSTLPLAANLRGKLFLMHGEMDDNVPPTLTMKLVDALIKADKDFDLLIIPNADHSAFYTSAYFIRRKWDYFVRNLMGAEPPLGYSIQAH